MWVSRAIRRASPGSLAALAIAVVAIGGGTAVAAKLIGSGDVRNNSLKSKDIKNGNLKSKDVKNRNLKGKDIANSAINGRQVKDGSLDGDAIRNGSLGSEDLARAARPARFTDFRLTPEIEGGPLDGLRVVEIPDLALSSGGPNNTDAEGTALFPAVNLTEGTYVVEGTVQFFDFLAGDPTGTEYGVARLFVGDQVAGTLWSPDVPDDGNNSAQTSASQVIAVPAGGATITVRGAMRTAEGDGGHAGGNLIVQKLP
jgi:hypothetical protein